MRQGVRTAGKASSFGCGVADPDDQPAGAGRADLEPDDPEHARVGGGTKSFYSRIPVAPRGFQPEPIARGNLLAPTFDLIPQLIW